MTSHNITHNMTWPELILDRSPHHSLSTIFIHTAHLDLDHLPFQVENLMIILIHVVITLLIFVNLILGRRRGDKQTNFSRWRLTGDRWPIKVDSRLAWMLRPFILHRSVTNNFIFVTYSIDVHGIPQLHFVFSCWIGILFIHTFNDDIFCQHAKITQMMHWSV